VPELNIDAVLALYDGWLQDTPFVPPHLKRIFDMKGFGMENEWRLSA
jgi:hypothetical protein